MARPVKTVTKPPVIVEAPQRPLFDTVSYIADGGKVPGAVARLVLGGKKPATLYLSEQGRASIRIAFGNRRL